jgi:hypothetical protein
MQVPDFVNVTGVEDIDLVVCLGATDPDSSFFQYFISTFPARGSVYDSPYLNTTRGAQIVSTAVPLTAHCFVYAPALNDEGFPVVTFSYRVLRPFGKEFGFFLLHHVHILQYSVTSTCGKIPKLSPASRFMMELSSTIFLASLLSTCLLSTTNQRRWTL